MSKGSKNNRATAKTKRRNPLTHPKLVWSLAAAKDLNLTEGYVGKVYDPSSKKIVGYAQSSTFDSVSLKAIDYDNIRTYVFGYCVGDEDDRPRVVDVVATSLDNALLAIGITNEYEHNWGDFGWLIEALLHDPHNIVVKTVSLAPVNRSDVSSAVSRIRGECDTRGK